MSSNVEMSPCGSHMRRLQKLMEKLHELHASFCFCFCCKRPTIKFNKRFITLFWFLKASKKEGGLPPKHDSLVRTQNLIEDQRIPTYFQMIARQSARVRDLFHFKPQAWQTASGQISCANFRWEDTTHPSAKCVCYVSCKECLVDMHMTYLKRSYKNMSRIIFLVFYM